MVASNFPRNLVEFEERFHEEEACREHLARLKWPVGYRCRKCGGEKYFLIASRNLHECAVCGDQESLTAGTVMQGTRKPLRLWFLAVYLLATSKRGISGAELGRKLGLSPRTAWSWLAKIRRALGRREQQRLLGTVEVDEAYIGGRRAGGKRGRGSENKTPIIAAIEITGGGPGRLRLAVAEGVDELSLHRFIRRVAVEGTTLKTDGFDGYNLMKTQGYELKQTVSRKAASKSEATPTAHLAISLLKRWLAGTHHGRVTPKHLPMYLDEFVYRFNRRKVKYEGRLAELMLENLVGAAADNYWTIIGRENPARLASNAA